MWICGNCMITAERETAPALPIVAISGHAPDMERLQVGTEVAAFLSKPFLRHTLLETVATALQPG